MKPGSTAQGRKLLLGMLVVAAMAVVASLARIGQDAVLAWRLGAQAEVDAFYFLLNLIAWPVAVALSTATLVLAPAAAVVADQDDDAASQFRAEVLGLTLIVASAGLPLVWWLLDALVRAEGSGLSALAVRQARTGVPAMAAAAMLGIVVAPLAAWMVARGRHELTLLEACPALALTTTLLLLPQASPALAWAAGCALQVLVVAVLLRLHGGLPMPRLRLRSPAWRPLARGAVIMLLGQMLFALVPLLDTFFAAHRGEGAVATFNYASRLVLGLQGVMALAVQRSGLPLLSRWMSRDPAQAQHAALRWAALAGLAGVLVGLLVAALADELVGMLFERGRFGAGDRLQVASLLRHGMLQMPVFLAGSVLITALVSARRLAVVGSMAALGLVFKLVFSLVLVPHAGLPGLLWATAIMYLATALMAWISLRRRR